IAFTKNSWERAYDVAVQADGKIVLSGWVSDSANAPLDFAVVRLSAGGALDTSFGTGGRVRIPFPGMNVKNLPVKLCIHAGGKIVIAGNSADGNFSYAALARVNFNGTLDTSFGNGGQVTGVPSKDMSGYGGLALQADGKLVVAGQTTTIDWLHVMVLARFNSN